MVSLKGHLVVKWSPEQIRHLICIFLSASAFLSSSGAFSWAPPALKPTDGLNMMFSPSVVVSPGPAGLPASSPILVHARRSATRGFSFFLTTVRRMRWVRFTFLPSSLMKMVTTVSVPSLFLETCGAGMAVARSGSPSSAQSTVFCAFVAMFAVVCVVRSVTVAAGEC